MIVVTAAPITLPSHVTTEKFKTIDTARKWCALLKRNNWKVISIEQENKE